MNKMDPFAAQNTNKTNKKAQSFIEAFKKTSADKPGSKLDLQELLKRRETKIRQQERTRHETIRREEKIIFSREQQQVKLQIQTLQQKIKQLAKEQTGLMKEAEKTAFQAVANPGVYHLNFFERLINLLELARKKISESKTWLQLCNQRSKRRNHYWGQVKKSGTKFMLSQERSMATQTG